MPRPPQCRPTRAPTGPCARRPPAHPPRRPLRLPLLLLPALLLAPPRPTPASAQVATDGLPARALEGLRFRPIGPAGTGGRIHDVEALPSRPQTLYVATASGGLWKSENGGVTWRSLFDEQPVSTFGDVAIAPSDPDIVYAGTGEQNNRQSTSWGNGVYRSGDGGASWRHLGLDETRHIGQVVVHPRDPDVVWVAALGNLWKPSPERGVFRSRDGGDTWEHVLAVDSLTGVVDLVLDPSDPDVLYAAAYQRLRRAWGFNGGGPGSGIYKSEDGGGTWRPLTRGLPAGDKGRIGLALAASDPRVLMALVEHSSEQGTYRSEDGGETWTKVNDLDPRPMYYSHIVIDPRDPDRVYVLATDAYRSDDGGRTFRELPTRPTYDVGVHADHHDLWIDPGNTDHLYLVGDAGLHESWDGGLTFRRIDNLPIGQFYDIDLDRQEPYWIYGGMQDNHSWLGPSRTRRWIGIVNDDWRQTGFGDGMFQQAHPEDPRTVYVSAQHGNLHRVDPLTGDRLALTPVPPEGEEYRFDWTAPLLLSRHDPSVLYLGGNRLFISRDGGVTWTRTEDLSRGIDRDTLALMGVSGAADMLSKNDGTPTFGEATTLAESPLDPAVLWVGFDDGNLQLSRDGGTTWTELSANIPGLPEGSYVSHVEASRSGPGVAYAGFDAHRDGDFAPYVYRTEDFGRSWTPLRGGLPNGSVNVIREHPENPEVLLLGTEHGLHASVNGGVDWTRWGAGLPTVPIDDIELHPITNDVVLGTHGRSLWILDDVAPLVEWTPRVAAAAVHLFSIRPAQVFHHWKDTSYRGQAAYAGENPPEGAILSYFLGLPADSLTVEVRDANGNLVRALGGPTEAGVVHRIAWDLRHEPPPGGGVEPVTEALPVPPRSLATRGPFVSPGTYSVAVTADGARASQTVLVEGDPLLALSQEDYEKRERFLLGLQDLQRRLADALDGLRPTDGATAAEGGAAERLRGLTRLQRELSSLAGDFNSRGVQQGTLFPPTPPMVERKRRLESRVEAALAEAGTVSGRGEAHP